MSKYVKHLTLDELAERLADELVETHKNKLLEINILNNYENLTDLSLNFNKLKKI